MNKKKKILVFIDWFLPGYKAGGPIRSCANLIDHLSDEYDFYVVTTDTDYLEKQPYSNIKPNCWVDSPQNNCKVYYISNNILSIAKFRRLIRKTEYDVAYVNGIFSFYFSVIPLFFLKHRNTVIASRGMLAINALKIKGLKKILFLWGMKRLGGYDNVKFHATNECEAKDIKQVIGGEVLVKVAPNLHKKSFEISINNISKTSVNLRLVSIARIAPEKNLLFGLKALLSVKTEAQISLDVYGAKYDEDYWIECSKVIEQLPSNIKVNYKGVIKSTEVEETISNYHFLFLPTAGENFGHAILESFTASRPVIISNRTPWVNLTSLNVGWDLELEISEFKEVIEKCVLLGDDEFQKMVNSCEKYAHKIISDKSIVEQSIKLFS